MAKLKCYLICKWKITQTFFLKSVRGINCSWHTGTVGLFASGSRRGTSGCSRLRTGAGSWRSWRRNGGAWMAVVATAAAGPARVPPTPALRRRGARVRWRWESEQRVAGPPRLPPRPGRIGERKAPRAQRRWRESPSYCAGEGVVY